MTDVTTPKIIEPKVSASKVAGVKEIDAAKTSRIPIKIIPQPMQRKPEWIRMKAPDSVRYQEIKKILRDNKLHTVCEEASCPNIGECFSGGTATFMILGDICTRRCPFCDVAHGKPLPPDINEPENLARTIAQMKLNYVVITSVDRDDLRDGGAQHFVDCIHAVRAQSPNIKIEILVPDFRGRLEVAMEILRKAPPDVMNHNLETIPRLYKQARPGSDYQNSLTLLKTFAEMYPDIPTKSGLMLGLGETDEEILAVMQDLRAHNVSMLTLGQYLQPSVHHLPVMRYVEPAIFEDLKQKAEAMGFNNTASGPMVRSSYHADVQAHEIVLTAQAQNSLNRESMVPHLTTALDGPLLSLEKSMLDAMPKIEHWFRTQWLEYAAPFYASVDLRNSGFKLAPVDTNLFPGGFNNLNPEFLPLSVQAAMVAVEKICPEAHRLLIIPENHTRNTYYLRNVVELANIMKQAGMDVRIGSISPEITEPTTLETADGHTLLLEPVVRVGNRIKLLNKELGDFDSCAILLNNDLSAGIPEILKNLEQDLIPPLHAGWSTRRKSQHFSAYNRVASEFSSLLGIDEWLLNPYFETCGEIDFHARTGEECLALKVEQLLAKIKLKYAQYGVTQEPFVIVKADAGTYGMGIMTVKSPDDVRDLNRKTRNKMSVVKEGLQVSEVIIQEGVYTFESINDAIAEPVVYMMDHFVIGGFYRVHTSRGVDENLNAPGSQFVPLAFEKPCTTPDCAGAPDAAPNRFYAYGVVARLALLAAAIELQEQDPLNQ